MNQPEGAKQVGDLAAVATTGFSLIEVLPAIAALFSIIWLAMRIYESLTGMLISETRLGQWVSKHLTRGKRDGED